MAKRWRSIEVDGKTYRYRGESYLVIQDSDGRRLAGAPMHSIKGVDVFVWERGQRKRTSDGMLKPAEIAAFIRSKLKERARECWRW